MNSRVRSISVVIAALLGSACAARGTASLPSEASTQDMTLGPDDVFEVRVFGEDNLTGKYRVGADGAIQFPFIGRVAVLGKEADQVGLEIGQRLREEQYLADPHVTVFIEQSNSKRVSVLGAVSKPGTFSIVPGMTVVHAVSNAGGFSALANKDQTVVTRRVGGKLERYRIAVNDVTKGNADDFPLRAGDIVFIPERVF